MKAPLRGAQPTAPREAAAATLAVRQGSTERSTDAPEPRKAIRYRTATASTGTKAMKCFYNVARTCKKKMTGGVLGFFKQ